LGEIAPARVPRDHRFALDRGEITGPALLRRADAYLEQFLVPLVGVLILVIELAELVLEQTGDAARVLWIEPIVRIAERVHVAHAPVDVAARYVEHGNDLRDVDVSRAAEHDSLIPRSLEEQRHPADLEVESDKREDVGIAKLQNEARLRLDEVWILIPFADMDGLDLVAAHRLGDVV